MFEENILETNFDDDVLDDDSIFDDAVEETLSGSEDDDEVDFESFDDSTPDW